MMKEPPSSIPSFQRGLTVIELSIAIVVSTFIMAGAYRTFLYFQKQSLVQNRIAQAQNQLFPAQEALEKNLRRASSGIPSRSVMRNASTGLADTVLAIAVQYNAAGPDSITLRGNFSDVASQFVSPVASTAATTDLPLLSGTAANFSIGDYVVLQNDGQSEYAQVASVNAGASTLRTGTRLYTYAAGTTVTKASSVQFLVAADSSLRMVQPSATAILLDKSVTSLKFKLISFGGIVDSTPPFQLDSAQYVQYSLNIRIPKTAGKFFNRSVSGRILMRDI